MTLKLYNTLTRKKEIFKPIKKTQVGLYTCGLTVYNYAHIGNLRTFIFEDVLRRVLTYNKYKVKHVQNITDVGHLTSDEDTGEDKLELGAKREGKSAWEVAKFYTKAFKADMKKLNMLPPQVWCKATDHIKEQIALIKKIEKNGFTYQIEDGIYFDSTKLKSYGKLIRLKVKGLKEGARVDVRGKKHKTDFALWKFSTKGKKRQMEWKSPWGVGFPGWHLECSAMAMKYLGNPFDIHCGGIDHAPVHHTNEMAQTEAATKKELAKIWMHGEFLTMKEEKMAKSKGNFITLQTVEQKGLSALTYRYWLLTAHYRSQVNFSWQALEDAQNGLSNLKDRIQVIKKEKQAGSEGKQYEKQFTKAINDDLNMPQAVATVWNLVRDKKVGNRQKLKLVQQFDEVLGLDLTKTTKVIIPQEIKNLAKQREQARKEKDFKQSDKLRNMINKKGFTIEDTPSGFKLGK